VCGSQDKFFKTVDMHDGCVSVLFTLLLTESAHRISQVRILNPTRDSKSILLLVSGLHGVENCGGDRDAFWRRTLLLQLQ